MHTPLIKEIEALAGSAEELFKAIRAASIDGAGITRPAYGPEETEAGKILAQFAASEGVRAYSDPVGNFRYELPGQQTDRWVVMGSHLDSVPLGGNYDGLAGVVAGIITQVACRRAGLVPHYGLRTFGFRGEESPWFGTAYLGSKLAFGLLKAEDLASMKNVRTGKSLADHLQEIGAACDDETIQKHKLHPENVHAYLELHIEQGPLLENMGIPIGIATAVRGNIRHPYAQCLGSYSHSSASPRHLRQDAVTATARLVVAADRRWEALLAAGGNDDLISNFGIFTTNATEHAMTKVPGEVSFSFVLAGTNDAVLQQLYRDIMDDAKEIEKACHVRFDFGPQVGTKPVALDSAVMEALETAAGKLGLASHRMPTVGHDAAMFAGLGIRSGMVLVRNQNGSHNVHESMEIPDFIDACKVLAVSALQL